MTNSDFHCQQCGGCCHEFYGCNFYAKEKDRERWEDQDEVILTNRGVMVWLEELIDELTGDIWIKPDGSDEYLNCPFLKKIRGQPKYRCLLQLSDHINYKPEVCRRYPFNEDGAIREDQAKICPEVRRLNKLASSL